MLNSILTETTSSTLTIGHLLVCMLVSLGLGAFLAVLHTFRNTYSKNFIVTLALLPAIVQVVITIVNGNLGTGVAVMGAFSLVRFRSVPGNSREIGSIFLAMAAGLAAGMGYLGAAVMMSVVIGGAMILLVSLPLGKKCFTKRELKITIPENLDYMGIFDDIFSKYTGSVQLNRVRTVNMGSLYELCYQVNLKVEHEEKEMLDQIRCRNGNLPVVCGRVPEGKEEL